MDINDLGRLKLRHLLAFVSTLQTGSLKGAAGRMHVTQSAVSKAIKDLEATLGVTLLKRDRGGIELTQEGAVFRKFAEQGLATLRQGMTSVEALRSGQGGAIRVGALPSVAADFLPAALQSFTSLSPGTQLAVEDGGIGTLIQRLRSGALDLVVGRLGQPETMHGLSFTQLYSEQVVFAAATGHDLAEETDLTKLGAAPILYPPVDAAIHPLVERFLLSEGAGDWPNRLITVSSAFGRAMTLGPTQAIWIISQGVVARDIAAGRMVTLPIDTRAMRGAVGVMARSEEDPTPAMRLFRQALLDTAQRRSAV